MGAGIAFRREWRGDGSTLIVLPERLSLANGRILERGNQRIKGGLTKRQNWHLSLLFRLLNAVDIIIDRVLDLLVRSFSLNRSLMTH